ncbi:MAG: redoxin domain-containing protein [Gammaproteobacteria bacterium]
MKTIALILCTWTLGATLALAEADIGKPAPDFTAKDIEGKSHKLADYKGKIVVLESYNLDCPFCANHFKTGAMQALQAEITAKGAVWLVVNSSNPKSPNYRNPAAAKKEWAAQKMKATAWIDDSDGKVGKAYGLKTTPHMVVIGKDGNVSYIGAIDDKAVSEGDPRTARNYVREAVHALLAGKAVEVSRTKSYGCAVKY